MVTTANSRGVPLFGSPRRLWVINRVILPLRLYRKGELGAEKPDLGVHTVGLPGGFLVRFPEALGA